MEIKQIKELMAAMVRTGSKRLKLKKGDFELVLEREEGSSNHRISQSAFMAEGDETYRESPYVSRTDQALGRGSEMPASRPSSPIHGDDKKEMIDAKYITSPMVGTFYMTPSPEDPVFVKVGDKVDKNTVVCIIEAMKVMNEIKANLAGTIVETLVENGQPVEFGTKLFRIID